MAAAPLFLVVTGVIVIDDARMRSATLPHHRRATIPAIRFALEKIGHLRLFRGRRPRHSGKPYLDTVEQFLVNERFGKAGDDLALVLILPDVTGITQDVGHTAARQGFAITGAISATVQFFDNLLLWYAIGVLLKHIADAGGALVVHHQLFILHLVAVRDGATAIIPLGDAFPQAAPYVLGQIGGVVFRHGFQQPFQDNALRAIRDVLLHGHDLDAVLLQLRLIDGAVVPVAGEPVQLPDDHHFKLLLGGVLDHALETRALILRARQSPVYVFPDHGDALLFRPGVVIV